MKLQRALERISGLASRGMAPRGIVEEGRIFAFGVFENEDHLHGRVTDVIEGLKDHVGQPFDLHPWAFVYEISTHKQDGNKTPIPVVGLVFPQAGGSVVVKDYLATPKGLRFTNQFVFHHTANGTTVTVQNRDGDSEDRVAGSLYPPAIAMLNTRGCSIDLKRAPTIVNAKRARKGKSVIPGHYDVDAREYFTASARLRNRPTKVELMRVPSHIYAEPMNEFLQTANVSGFRQPWSTCETKEMLPLSSAGNPTNAVLRGD